MKSQILFIDDEQLVLDAIRRMLIGQRDVWEMTFVQQPERGWELLLRRPFDLVVLDVKMAGLNGLELLERIRQTRRTAHVPVVMLTGVEDRALKRRALDLGALDLLNKPVDPEDLLARLGSALRLKAHEDKLNRYRRLLERRVRERTAELFQSRLEILWRLGQIAEQRDEQTGNHVVRVGCMSRVVAEAMGMDGETAETLFLAAPLHDIGKVAIPDAILLKRGPLSPGEWAVMQQHCLIGERILRDNCRLRAAFVRWRAGALLDEEGPTENPLLRTAAIIARTHHEKWDGSGYPMGLSGDAIPIESRIVAIADVYDALTHERPYKPAFSESTALEIIADASGGHFDPDVHRAFLDAMPEIRIIHQQFDDHAPLAALDEETRDEKDLVCR